MVSGYLFFLIQLTFCSAFLTPQNYQDLVSRNVRVLEAVAVVYDTMGGNTETCANYIADEFGVQALNINDLSVDQIKEFECLVVGAPTWHTDADEERSGTEWDTWLYNECKTIDFTGKKVACFGVGDSIGYSDNFVDAMEELHSCFKERNAEMHGYTDPSGYQHTDSKSIIDGSFCGLPLDEDNESDLSEERCKKWVSKLKEVGFT